MIVALLGCSHPHSRWHLVTLSLLPEVEGVWLWDSDEAAAREAAAQTPVRVLGVTADLDEVLARPEVQLALVARRNDETPGLVERAARAGKRVLSEKPMATSPKALQPALAAAREAGI